MKNGRKTKTILPNASLKNRAIAYIIDFSLDFILLFLLTAGIGGLYQNVNTQSKGNFVLFCSIIVFIYLFIYLPTKHNGQTLGKMLLKIKTESTEKDKIGYFLNFAREFVFKFMFVLILVPLTIIQIMVYYLKNHTFKNIKLFHDAILFTRVVSVKQN